MSRTISLLLLSVSLLAQTPASLDKPPQDVDDALRARIKTFYDLHVEHKYRQAEQLIAEESKDDFYTMSKPQVSGFRIASIEYSDHFTKAKALIVGRMQALLPMFGPKEMDIPFASFWKIDDGKWCWYYNKEFARHTPFGDVKDPGDSKNGAAAATSLPDAPQVSIQDLQTAVKVDRTEFSLGGPTPVTITIKNTLAGTVSLQIGCPVAPMELTGITAAFGSKTLKAHESTTLTLTAGPTTRSGVVTLRISVAPTNQIIDLKVKTSSSAPPAGPVVSAAGTDKNQNIQSAVANASLTRNPPSVCIDTPAAGSVVSGVVTVTGWAINNVVDIGTAVGSVVVKVDGVVAGTATYGVSRADVCNLWPGRASCPNVGYSYSLNTSSLSPGTHTITVSAKDTGRNPVEGSSATTVAVPPKH